MTETKPVYTCKTSFVMYQGNAALHISIQVTKRVHAANITEKTLHLPQNERMMQGLGVLRL
jgi:hypothetical protein